MMKPAMKLDDEIDALFQQSLADFTSSRNALASRLKKDGRAIDAERVKLLAKPSVSAWAVNQLYWEHRDAFNELIATGKRVRTGVRQAGGKAANMRDSLDARRDALVQLSDLATELLTDAGHNPSLDTLRRVTTTLEALSAYALLGSGPTPGRLSNDVDPPSFESLALLMSGVSVDDVAEPRSRKSAAAAPAKQQKATPKPAQKAAVDDEARKQRQLRIAAAKITLQEAKKSLVDARAMAQSLESMQKKAKAEVKDAETVRREAEARLAKAVAVADAATRRAQSVSEEIEEAAQAIEDAKRAVDEATKELESSLRE